MKTLLDSIKEHEGFSGKPYKDSKGIPTIGYGTKLPLSKKEGEDILKSRLNGYQSKLLELRPFVANLPEAIQSVLFEMSYQMGVGGLLKFHKTWTFIKSGEFEKASVEMLDSQWARDESPLRALELSEIVRAT
ncbi:MAG: hypothetical protein QM497_04760 [Sulfurimonas sp.]